MAEVSLNIGGRHYDVHCGDGEERHLLRLAGMIDAKMTSARTATPGLTEVRQLLFAAILLADEIHDLRAQGNNGQGALDFQPGAQPGLQDRDDEATTARIAALAARVEALADALAQETPAS